MPRQTNKTPTVIVKISTTEQVKSSLERLVPRGYYGKTVPEVADRLLSEKIRQLIRDGELAEQ